MKMLQEPWFTWIFFVIPFAVALICKYWLMREIWDEDCPSKWRDFVNYYMAGSVLFWGIISFGRLQGCTFS